MTKPHRGITASIALLGLIGGSAAAVECQQVSGTVKLALDPSCQVAAAFPGIQFVGQQGSCFVVAIEGSLRGTGFSGATIEPVASLVDGSGSLTPLIALETGRRADPTLPFGTRQFFTARTVATVKGGKLYTADAGVRSNSETAEQLHITGGEGVYKGATGTVYVTGNDFAGAPYRGTLCLAK